MKILAFNASPRKNGTTNELMTLMLDSAREEGADVEHHFVDDLNVKGCVGCFSCWWQTPGKCIHRDDMDWVLPRMVEADALVIGTPVYHYNIRHNLQRLRERTLPLAMPEFEVRDRETDHPSRYKRSHPQKQIIISVCGFPDLSNFNQVTELFPEATKVYLPTSGILKDPDGRRYIQGFLDAVKQAGKELVKMGDVLPETSSKLIVDYPPEIKKRIIESYNRASRQVTPPG